MKYNILLFAGVVFNVVAQILLKKGMRGTQVVEAGSSFMEKISIFLFNPYFWAAVISYGFGFIVYSIVLSKMELNKAYPISSVSIIILILIFSILFLNETITLNKVAGILLCVAGIIVIFR